jgi:metal-responsive CopG/Arc/MetJ family transcriptional regulator
VKTTVSIPDDVFRNAERLARRSKKSRSQLYSEAIKEYVARHAIEEVTEALNRVCDQVGDQNDPFLAAAARSILERSQW